MRSKAPTVDDDVGVAKLERHAVVNVGDNHRDIEVWTSLEQFQHFAAPSMHNNPAPKENEHGAPQYQSLCPRNQSTQEVANIKQEEEREIEAPFSPMHTMKGPTGTQETETCLREQNWQSKVLLLNPSS